MSDPERRLRDRIVAKDAEIARLREVLPALWGQYDDDGRKLWIDPAEAMRAKCEAIARKELNGQWPEWDMRVRRIVNAIAALKEPK